MKKKPLLNFSFSFFYACCQITLGLFLHPYQTMFSLMREKFLRLLVFAPTLIFFCLTLIWRLFLRPLTLLFLSATCPLMIIKTTVLFFCFFLAVSSAISSAEIFFGASPPLIVPRQIYFLPV